MSGGPLSHTLFFTLLAANLFALGWFGLTLFLHPAPVVRRVSLRALARNLLIGKSRRERLRRRWIESRESRLVRLASFACLGAIVFLPIDLAPGRTFGNPGSASDFIGTMWQVVAGALGLSVAMIAFAFEAFFSSAQRQVGGSLREFARDTHLLSAVQLGVLALVINGAVLLGVGHSAPAGWAAIWATVLSAGTLISVPIVLGRVVRSLDFDELVRLRRKRLQRIVEEAMWHQLQGQAAEALLRGMPELGVERDWISSGGLITVKAGREGVIGDVRLGSLQRIAARAKRRWSPPIRLKCGLGDTVGRSSEILALAPAVNARERRAMRRAVRIRRPTDTPPDRRLTDQLDRLHADAKSALRDGQTEDWRPIGDFYRLVLIELAANAKRLGVDFEGAIAAPGIFSFGPVQRIVGYLRKELEAAVEGRSVESADAIAYLPGMIAREALEEGALVIARQMLSLYASMYWLGRRDGSDNRAAGLLLDRSTRYLLDFDHQVEAPFEDATSTDEQRAQALELGHSLFLQINSIEKEALEQDDRETFSYLDRRWIEMFSERLGYPLDFGAEERSTPQGLVAYRAVLQFGLAMWAARVYKREGTEAPNSEDARVEALRTLASRYYSVEEVLDVHEAASKRDDNEDRLPWTDWFLDEFGEGVHGIPTTSELLFTALLIIVARRDFDLVGVELRPRFWLESEAETDAAIARLREEDARWAQVFGVPLAPEPEIEDELPDWGSRVDRLQALLAESRAATQDYRRAEVRDAPLDETKVATFRRELIEATRKARIIHDLFATQGALVEVPDNGGAERILSPAWLPRSLFVAKSNMVGLESTARSLARATRGREGTMLVEALEPIEAQAPEGELATRLREEIARMEEDGTPATLLLLPLSFRLNQSIGLSLQGGIDGPSDLVPWGRHRDFAGLFEGVPALDSPRAPADRLWLVNLPSAARLVEWGSEQDSGIELELQEFDAEGAAQMLREHPEVRSKEESEEQALLTLQDRVFAKQFYCWQIEPREFPAGICFTVPEELRR